MSHRCCCQALRLPPGEQPRAVHAASQRSRLAADGAQLIRLPAVHSRPSLQASKPMHNNMQVMPTACNQACQPVQIKSCLPSRRAPPCKECTTACKRPCLAADGAQFVRLPAVHSRPSLQALKPMHNNMQVMPTACNQARQPVQSTSCLPSRRAPPCKECTTACKRPCLAADGAQLVRLPAIHTRPPLHGTCKYNMQVELFSCQPVWSATCLAADETQLIRLPAIHTRPSLQVIQEYNSMQVTPSGNVEYKLPGVQLLYNSCRLTLLCSILCCHSIKKLELQRQYTRNRGPPAAAAAA
jgi:hypothetical protein